MASLITVFLLSLFACYLGSFFAESRKGLRSKELSQKTFLQLEHSVYPNRIDPTHVHQLSWRPRVFLYEGFLSDKECDYLISLAQTVKEKSSEVDRHLEGDVMNQKLTSDTLLTTEDDIIARIEERISLWTFLPKENSKPMQVMHYGLERAGQNYNIFNKSDLELSGSLMATVVLYLSNVTQGGQILFPESEPKSASWYDCSSDDSYLKPIKGSAILFFSLHLSASPDKSSSHARCPVLEGEMWSATKFFYARPAGGEKISSSLYGGNECTDEDDNCATWAAMGECQRNPVYMIGSPDYFGTCRKSCNAC
ncbi:probable prolyl 4-hydroxylase 12 [Prosopis cineraria]|uniref:probable prolyl 4-hydroxylase 12 n=1 Tax=Prosopis cineraria TaxID=364024 RepID=UPI00240EBA11|nr:probable prolyl 4-hydroxylase 12 [Prosopis cineraria]